MVLSNLRIPCMRLSLRSNSFHPIGCQQARCYQPRKMSKRDRQKILEHVKPYIPSPENPRTRAWQLEPDVKKSYQRLAWAKLGSASGVDLREILPSKDDLPEEWEAEKRWWPTLQEMRDDIQRENAKKAKERREYEKRVADNMAKMPKWIEQWEAEKKKQEEMETKTAMKRDSITDQAMEDFDYKYDENSPEIKAHIYALKEKERKEKKMLKKLSKGKNTT